MQGPKKVVAGIVTALAFSSASLPTRATADETSAPASTPKTEKDLQTELVSRVQAKLNSWHNSDAVEYDKQHGTIDKWVKLCFEKVSGTVLFKVSQNLKSFPYGSKNNFDEAERTIAYVVIEEFRTLDTYNSIVSPSIYGKVPVPAGFEYCRGEHIDEQLLAYLFLTDPAKAAAFIADFEIPADRRVTKKELSAAMQDFAKRLDAVGNGILSAVQKGPLDFVSLDQTIRDLTADQLIDTNIDFLTKPAFLVRYGLEQLKIIADGRIREVLVESKSIPEDLLLKAKTFQTFKTGLIEIFSGSSVVREEALKKLERLAVSVGLINAGDQNSLYNAAIYAEDNIELKLVRGRHNDYVMPKGGTLAAEHAADLVSRENAFKQYKQACIVQFKGEPVLLEDFYAFAEQLIPSSEREEFRQSCVQFALENYGPGKVFNCSFSGAVYWQINQHNNLFFEVPSSEMHASQLKLGNYYSPTIKAAFAEIDNVSGKRESELSEQQIALKPLALKMKDLREQVAKALSDIPEAKRNSSGVIEGLVFSALGEEGQKLIQGGVFENGNWEKIEFVTELFKEWTQQHNTK